jgi:serralysin
LSGEGGDDTYVFAGTRLGRDSIVNEAANADSDTLDFSGYAQAVDVNLAAWLSILGPSPAQHAVDSTNLRVTLFDDTAIETVIGTEFGDHITGNSRDNKLEGRAGSDIYHFSGSNLGTDEIVEDQSADSDGLDFSGLSQALTIDLMKVGADYAVNLTALRLKLSNDTAIEKVWGTDFDDKITGNGRDNHIYGRRGNDKIVGGIGADYLSGGEGMDKFTTDSLDTVFGGAGLDTFDSSTEFYLLTNPRPSRYRDWAVI